MPICAHVRTLGTAPFWGNFLCADGVFEMFLDNSLARRGSPYTATPGPTVTNSRGLVPCSSLA